MIRGMVGMMASLLCIYKALGLITHLLSIVRIVDRVISLMSATVVLIVLSGFTSCQFNSIVVLASHWFLKGWH